MIEIRFHGRGGQGSVLASYMLCKAAFIEGKDVQSFTFFGAERRGAPVVSFARIAAEPIILRCQIYTPNRIIVMDPTLMRSVEVFAGVKAGSIAFFNSDGPLGAMAAKTPEGVDVLCINATAIALKHKLGNPESPVVNTAVLGGFAGATGVVGCDALEEALRDTVPVRTEENVNALREAYTLAGGGKGRHDATE